MRIALIVVLVLIARPLAAQVPSTCLYYPVDDRNVFLWDGDAASPLDLTTRDVSGKWNLSAKAVERWSGLLPTLAPDCAIQNDPTSCAVEHLVARKVPPGKATLRFPDAQATFVSINASTAVLIARSSSLNVALPFSLMNGRWSKSGTLPMDKWLALESEPAAADLLATGLGADAPSTTAPGKWPDYWNAVGTVAATRSRLNGLAYADTSGGAKWLLVDSGANRYPAFNRLTVSPPVPIEPPVVPTSGGPEATATLPPASWPFIPRMTVVSFAAGTLLGFLGSVLFARTAGQTAWSLPALRWPRRKREPDSPGNDLSDAATSLPAAGPPDEEIARLLDSLREPILKLVESRLAGPPRGGTSTDAQRLDAALREIHAQNSLVEKLQVSVDSLQTALDNERRRAAENDRRRLELETLYENARAELTQSATSAVELQAQLLDVEASRQRELSEIQVRHEQERAAERASAAHDRRRLQHHHDIFEGLRSIAENLQDGQKHYLSSRDDGLTTALVGFLAAHSLTLLGVALASERKEHAPPMLLNLQRLCTVLKDYKGFELALANLLRSFGPQAELPPSAAHPAEERSEAAVFQYALRYLRESQRLEFAPYYFWINDSTGMPYRAA